VDARRVIRHTRSRLRCARKGHRFTSQVAGNGQVVELCLRCGARGRADETRAA